MIHLAAYYDFSGAPSPLYDEITVRGTERLLRMLQDFEVEQFIFSSTDLVYAPSAPGQRINEDSPLQPKWPYPQSKVKTEQVIHAERGKIPAVILRIAGVYNDLCDSIPLAQQIQRIYERDITAYLFPGEVSAGRQAFVHNEDVVEAIVLAVAARKKLPPELTLLIGEPESPGYDELQRAFGQLIHGVAWKTRALPKFAAKVGAWAQEKLPLNRPPFIKPWMIDLATDNFELDIKRAHKILGWHPRHSVRDTLPKMIPALKADPFAWYHENEINPPLWLREMAPASDETKDIEPHELMRLEKEVRRAIAMPSSMAMTKPVEHMKGTGKNNSAWWYESNGRKLFHVQREDIHMSFGCAPDFTRRSVGCVGFSDGWQDLMDDFKMDWEFEQAEDGKLALIGEIDLSDGVGFTLGVGFGRTRHSASAHLLHAFATPFADQRKKYVSQWQRTRAGSVRSPPSPLPLADTDSET